MDQYRLYLLDGFSGHIAQVRAVAAASDAEALAAAAALRTGAPMELRHGHRKLKHWDEVPQNAD